MAVCWHPKFPILAVATDAAVVEYDAISGCRRNFVESSGSPIKLRYTQDGSHIILLTKVGRWKRGFRERLRVSMLHHSGGLLACVLSLGLS